MTKRPKGAKYRTSSHGMASSTTGARSRGGASGSAIRLYVGTTRRAISARRLAARQGPAYDSLVRRNLGQAALRLRLATW